jgi:hypothetical protein
MKRPRTLSKEDEVRTIELELGLELDFDPAE